MSLSECIFKRQPHHIWLLSLFLIIGTQLACNFPVAQNPVSVPTLPVAIGTPTFTAIAEVGVGGVTIIPTITPAPRNTDASSGQEIIPTSDTSEQTNPVTSAPIPSIPPDATDTPAPTPSPTAKSGIQFALRNNAVGYEPGLNCEDMIISGTVVTADGQPLSDIPVRITGPNKNVTVLSGANPEYGIAGWQVLVSATLVEEIYHVQVINGDLEGISELIVVKTIPECDSNTARLVFEQLP